MQLNLSANEIRILGVLMEKSVITPDVYPLTLNSLTTGCNQKSSREPVTSLAPATVRSTLRSLQEKHLVRVDENFKNGVEKFTQTFCNTEFGKLQLTPPQFAIMCLLLLRGAQTPGELKARSGRLHTFPDANSVVDTLEEMASWEHRKLIVKLPRSPGRKDSEYMHLLGEAIDIEALTEQAKAAKESSSSSHNTTLDDLTNRVSQLEADLAELKQMLGV